jgi:hypothetical protein
LNPGQRRRRPRRTRKFADKPPATAANAKRRIPPLKNTDLSLTKFFHVGILSVLPSMAFDGEKYGLFRCHIFTGGITIMATKKKPAAKKPAAKKSAAKAPKKGAKKAAPRAAKKKSATKRKPNAAFMKPMMLSAALSAVLGAGPLPRTEVTKKIWVYIKKNGLQDAKNRRMINADDKLRVVFGGKKQVSMFEMTKLVNGHLK